VEGAIEKSSELWLSDSELCTLDDEPVAGVAAAA